MKKHIALLFMTLFLIVSLSGGVFAQGNFPPTATPTGVVATPTNTPTSIPTDTPTNTPTDTPTSTVTNTPLPTDTPIPTPTNTLTNTPTSTATSTPTSTPTNTAIPTATVVGQPAPHISGQTILAKYWINGAGGTEVNNSIYRPRQWNNGILIHDNSAGDISVPTVNFGVGCDVWVPNNYGSHRGSTNPQLLEILLNRDATVYVVWRNSITQKPTWLDSSYQQLPAFTVNSPWWKTYTPFKKNISAGTNFFPGPVTGTGIRELPWFIFCESDNSATLAPSGGIVPNQPCPQSLHDSWTAVGPDGNVYPTWHPQIDPTYWCYYQHEHGSDPALFSPDWHPLFGYTASKAGMSENHTGFKVYVFDSQDGVYRFGIVNHFGTSGQLQACISFHTVDIIARQGGTILADTHFMANFGAARNNDNTSIVYTPANCPNQGQLATGTGARLIPMAPNGTAYEPWRMGTNTTILRVEGSLTFNTNDQIVFCADTNCSTVLIRPENFSGTRRFITNTGVGFGFTKVQSANSFCTNAMGDSLLSCNDPAAVQQFVGQTFRYFSDLEVFDTRGWGGLYVYTHEAPPTLELENSIPNGGPN